MIRALPAVIVLAIGCKQHPQVVAERGDCMESNFEVGPDDATPLGGTPRELAQSASPQAFAITWSDPTNPVATAWMLTLDDSAAAGSVTEWSATEPCPTGPSAVIDVDGTLATDGLQLGAFVRMQWDQPMGLGGQPTFSAETYPFDPVLESWVWSVVKHVQPGIEGTLESLYLQGRMDDGVASLSAEVMVEGELVSFDAPEFRGTLSLSE